MKNIYLPNLRSPKMPIPKPKKDEKRSDFIDRCMSDSVMQREFPRATQRMAVCQTSWADKDKEKS